ncbi:MAG: DALR domain-containing protein [Solirubrobacteraceae bacterium]
MREIRLYDSLSGELVPVTAGDAIRVEVRASPNGGDGIVDVESTRPLVLFAFLERFLQREGFGTKFLFDSPSGEDMLYELSEGRRPSPFGMPEANAEIDTEMSLMEIPRADVERWVNVCFGAGRDGEEWEPVEPSSRILLSDALNHFGHPAVAIYLLGTHYSMPLGDPFEGLVTGSKNAGRIREVLKTLKPEKPSPPDMHHYVESFREALADDLDTPLAFVVLFEWVLEAERRGGQVGDNDLRVMLEVLELEDLAAPAGV